MVAAIEKGYPQKEIAEASYQFQRANEAREKITVGANEFVVDEPSPTFFTSAKRCAGTDQEAEGVARTPIE